jgi:putative PEP-CTERM system TPR-repeat lipoprotein
MTLALWRSTAILAAALTVAACGPSTPDEVLAAANKAIAAGEIRTAEIHLKNLLQSEPSNVAARSLLGELLLVTNDPSGAEHNLLTAIELGADSARLHLALLRSLLAQNKFAALIDRASSGPELEGAERVAKLKLIGAAQRGLGRLEDSERSYQAALAIEPGSVSTRTELAAVSFQAGRIAAARSAVEAVLANDMDYVPALLLLGSMEAAATRFAAARELFERALSLETERKAAGSYGVALAQLTETHLAERELAAADRRVEELLTLNPQAPLAIYLKARVETEQGNLDSAERRLETLIAAVPDYWPAYLMLGVVNANQRQLGQAEMYLRRAANSNPGDARTQLLLADIYLRQEEVGEARAVIDGAATPNQSVFLALAGRASLDAGQPELAAEYFARSEQTRPGTLQALIDVSSVYVAAGELERAVRVLESAAFQEVESERVANYLLTLIQLRRGNLTAADATAQRLTDPSAESLNLRGTIAMLGENYARARQLFENALEQQETYVPALLNLARVAVSQRENGQAAEYLLRALAIDANQIGAIFGLAQLAAERRDYAEAETWLSRAPESPLRSRLTGDVRFAQQQFAAAADEYSRAFNSRPSVDLALREFAAAKQAGRERPEQSLLRWSESNPRDERANFALGTVALESGDRAGAEARYEIVLEADPSHLGALNNLAWLYGERGDARALGLAERAYSLHPDDPSVADTLGWIRVRGGEAALGLPLLEKAVASMPKQPEIRYHYASALAATGDRARARKILSDLIAESAPFPSEAQARAALAELDSGAP